MTADIEVHDNPAQHRYEILVDGRLAGFALYFAEPQQIVFVHTEVALEYEGRGLAGRLARFSLDDVRERGIGAVPLCPFYASYIGGHPEYQDLVRPRAHRRTVLTDRNG